MSRPRNTSKNFMSPSGSFIRCKIYLSDRRTSERCWRYGKAASQQPVAKGDVSYDFFVVSFGWVHTLNCWLKYMLQVCLTVGVQVNFPDYIVRNIWQNCIGNTDLWGDPATTYFLHTLPSTDRGKLQSNTVINSAVWCSCNFHDRKLNEDCICCKLPHRFTIPSYFNALNPELNSICCLLALLGANHFLHVSRIRVKLLTLRLLM